MLDPTEDTRLCRCGHERRHHIHQPRGTPTRMVDGPCALPGCRCEAFDLNINRWSRWDEFQEDTQEWARQTFPDQTIEGKFAHLMEELIEIVDAPDDRSEWADALILLLDAAALAGHTAEQLLEAAIVKMAVNRERNWGEADEDGIVRHIEETTEPKRKEQA